MPWQLQKSRSAELTAISKEHWQRKEFQGYVTQNNNYFCNHWKALVSKQFGNALEPFICRNGFCYDVRCESILPKFSSSNHCSVDGIKFWLLCNWIIWIIFTTFDMIITMKGGIKAVVKGRPTCIWDQLLAGQSDNSTVIAEVWSNPTHAFLSLLYRQLSAFCLTLLFAL